MSKPAVPPESGDTEEPSPFSPDDTLSDGGYRTLASGFLSPRHRRLAQLAAQGLSNKAIGKELGYVDSRVSILLKHPLIREEITRLQDQVFSDTIAQRLKGMADAALSTVEKALKDQTGRTKQSEKLEVAKWVLEKVDGKASQTIDVGASTLGTLLDRLDSLKSAGKALNPALAGSDGIIDVTPDEVSGSACSTTNGVKAPRTEEDDLSDWVTQFDSSERK